MFGNSHSGSRRSWLSFWFRASGFRGNALVCAPDPLPLSLRFRLEFGVRGFGISAGILGLLDKRLLAL